MGALPADVKRAARQNPIPGISTLVSEKKSRSWGPMSVGIFRRPPGEVIWRSDYYRISYVLSDICGAKQSDDGAIEEYQLQPADLAFRPPDWNYGAICPAAGLSRSYKIARLTTIWSLNWCAEGAFTSIRKTYLVIH
jgi:hypothetical protein